MVHGVVSYLVYSHGIVAGFLSGLSSLHNTFCAQCRVSVVFLACIWSVAFRWLCTACREEEKRSSIFLHMTSGPLRDRWPCVSCYSNPNWAKSYWFSVTNLPPIDLRITGNTLPWGPHIQFSAQMSLPWTLVESGTAPTALSSSLRQVLSNELTL